MRLGIFDNGGERNSSMLILLFSVSITKASPILIPNTCLSLSYVDSTPHTHICTPSNNVARQILVSADDHPWQKITPSNARSSAGTCPFRSEQPAGRASFPGNRSRGTTERWEKKTRRKISSSNAANGWSGYIRLRLSLWNY